MPPVDGSRTFTAKGPQRWLGEPRTQRVDGVLLCGSRTWQDGSRIYDVLRVFQWTQGNFTVIHGDATGADRVGGRAAKALGLKVEAYPADWKRHGKRAGYIRNKAMLDMNPSCVLAFWDGVSPGTKMMLELATEREVPYLVFTPIGLPLTEIEELIRGRS